MKRLARLKTSSPSDLTIAWVVEAAADSEAIERRAHVLLNDQRRAGEWFDTSISDAVGAVQAAAGDIGVTVAKTPSWPTPI